MANDSLQGKIFKLKEEINIDANTYNVNFISNGTYSTSITSSDEGVFYGQTKVYEHAPSGLTEPVCFTFDCKTPGSTNNKFGFNKSGNVQAQLEYSNDNITYSAYTFGTALTITNTNKLYFRAKSGVTNNTLSVDESNYIYMNFYRNTYNKTTITGNVMMLLNSSTPSTTITSPYCFYSVFGTQLTDKMFIEQQGPIDASGLLLPATTVSDYCYAKMFRGTRLTHAPALPATSVGAYAYYYMFQCCAWLQTIPALPATTLGDGCYECMFYSCIYYNNGIKMSETQTVEYPNAYPIVGNPTGKATLMFGSTRGDYTSDGKQGLFTAQTVVSPQ